MVDEAGGSPVLSRSPHADARSRLQLPLARASSVHGAAVDGQNHVPELQRARRLGRFDHHIAVDVGEGGGAARSGWQDDVDDGL